MTADSRHAPADPLRPEEGGGLLKHGANVNAASKQGWTPLMAAAWEGHTSIVKALLKHGANASLVNSERLSAMMLAEAEGHREVVKLLNVAK